MKRTAKAKLAAVVTAATMISAASMQASPVVYEPFSYPVGDLHGKAGSFEVGLMGTWDAKVEAEHSTVVTNESLYGAYASLGGKIGPLSGGVNKYGGSRAINAAALAGNGLLDDGATLWMSVVMGYGAGGNVTNSRLAVALANDTFNSGNYNYWIEDNGPQAGEGVGVVLGKFSLNGRAMPVQFRNLAAGDGVDGNIAGAWTGTGTALGANQNALYVVKFTWGANSSQPDSMEVYQPNGNLSLGSPISTLSNIYVNQAAFDMLTFARGDVMVLDEIRFGASYADVAPPNVTGPALVTKNPLGSSGLLPLKATFDRNILVGQGDIRIYNSNGSTLHSTIAVADASRVAISGNEMTITPSAAFTVGQSYYIEMDAGAVKDAANNHFAGFVGSSVWSFDVGSLTDPNGDPDGDGLTSGIETTLGSNPLVADTDGDGLNDGFEYYSGTYNLLVADYVAPPTFLPVAGTSLTKFSVVLSCASAGATIHYTVTGADPTIYDPSVVSGGTVVITQNMTLKAKAFVGADFSEISSTTFDLTGDVSAGAQSLLALVTNGQVYGWGNQGSGRLSNGLTAAGNLLAPALAKYSATSSITNVTSISAGTSHGLVLDVAGGVWGFGANSFGESGNSSTAATVPYALPVVKSATLDDYLTGCTKVSAGLEFSAALESGGFVQTWGNQRHGRLGNGTNVAGSRKFAGRVKVSPTVDLGGIRDIALGRDFALAREACAMETAGSLGKVWVWGNNASGNLGIGNTIVRSYALKAKLNSTTELGDAWDVDAGDDFAAVVRWKTGDPALQGSVWTFGNRVSGRLGDNGAITGNSSFPVQVQKFDGAGYSQLNGIIQVSAGASHTLAVDDAGNVWAWGGNATGALGDNTTVDKNHAVKVRNPDDTADLSNIVRVSAGGGAGSAAFSTAIAADGTIYVWGSNAAGQLANGTASTAGFAKLPVVVSQLQTIPGFPTVSLNAAVTATGLATLTATVDDPQGDSTIQKTEFYVQGVLQATRTEPPWTASLTSLEVGTYTAYAKTSDVDGNETTSLPTSFDIHNDDTDDDGMSDSWEMFYFGDLNQSGAGDFDGDGITNAMELANGTNPADYYNEAVPVLAVASGDNQAINPLAVTPEPVVFSVKNETGDNLENAPVTIAITSPASDNGALDSISSGEFTDNSITGATNSSGQISVYFKSPATFTSNTTITLSLGNSPVVATVSATVIPAPIEIDSDDDGMPDGWEIANGLDPNDPADAEGDADEDYLTNLEEFQNGTDPNLADTDGDGLIDGWEIAHGLDPNDNGSINLSNGANGIFQNSTVTNGQAQAQGVQANPNATLEDHDADGLTNDQEAIYATNPQSPDSDGDGLSDSEDGWAMDANLQLPRISKNYVILDLSEYLPLESEEGLDTYGTIEIDDLGGILYATTTYPDDPYIIYDVDTTAKYFHGGNVYGANELPYYNKQIDLGDGIIPWVSWISPSLSPNGELHYAFYLEKWWGNFWDMPISEMDEKHHVAAGTSSVIYNLQQFRNYTINGYSGFHCSLAANSEPVMNLWGQMDDYEGHGLHDAGKVFGIEGPEDKIYPYALKIGNDPLFEKSVTFAQAGGSSPTVLAADISYEIGRNGTKIVREALRDVNGLHETFHDNSTPQLGTVISNGSLPRVISVGDETDILSWDSAMEYSSDRGNTRHPFRIVSNNVLENTTFPGRAASNEFILLPSSSPWSDIILNQRRTPIEEVIENSEGWSNFVLYEINKHGQIVGAATKDNIKRIVTLLPVEVAPEVLAVNSDFDEGRIDPATGYAIPDCDDVAGVDQKTGSGNAEIALNAKRDHLDGDFTNDEKVTKDMHKGWFGVNPKLLDDAFWDGATVTIKKIDKIDDDTGYKESGQVRFYAKWGSGDYYGISPYDFTTLQAVNLVSAGVNKRPGEGVYGSTSTIPDNAEFWMEGVRPGKITLEWRYQKGSTDLKHEQTFQVETHQTVAEWREEVRYQIRLQTKVKTGTEVDVAQYHPGDGFRNADAAKDNVLRVNAIYDYYQQLFKQMPEKFMWAGMAKVAAAPIYAGMSDLHTWWLNSGWFPRPKPRGFLDPGIQRFINGLLLGGQKNIFTDKAWAHRAYKASGIGALNHVELTNRLATNFGAWKLMDAGIIENDQSKIFEANGRLLRREQQEVVQQNYDVIQNLWIYQPPAHPNINGGVWVAVNSEGLSNAGEWLSANSNNNPLPGGPGFRATFPDARLDFFNDRWAWTSNAASGMLGIWTGASTSAPGYDAGRRASENGKTIKAAATNYSYDPAAIP